MLMETLVCSPETASFLFVLQKAGDCYSHGSFSAFAPLLSRCRTQFKSPLTAIFFGGNLDLTFTTYLCLFNSYKNSKLSELK